MSRENLDGSRTPEVHSDTESYQSEQTDLSPISPIVSDDFPCHPAGSTLGSQSPYVLIPSAELPNNAGCCSKTSTAIYHFLDFAKITLVTQTLLSRWLHQLFLELARYDGAPSMEVRETWLGYPIIGMAALLSMTAKALNEMYSKEKYLGAEDYVAALFRSAHLYFILDLWSGMESMPLGVFIATSAIALPLLMAFFTKHALSDTDDRFYLRKADFDYLSTSRISIGSNAERSFNLLDGLHYGTASISTFMWAVNREVHGRTVELPAWQMALLGVGMLGSAKVGYDLTDHPMRFQLLAMASKFFKEGALAYAAASGIFYMICRDEPSCSDVGARVVLIMACSIIALSVGLYAALTTRFRFEENCERIEKTIADIRNAPETVSNELASIGNHVSRFFTSCCKKEEVGSDLLAVSLA